MCGNNLAVILSECAFREPGQGASGKAQQHHFGALCIFTVDWRMKNQTSDLKCASPLPQLRRFVARRSRLRLELQDCRLSGSQEMVFLSGKRVNGGGIMFHAWRLGGPVAAAQKNYGQPTRHSSPDAYHKSPPTPSLPTLTLATGPTLCEYASHSTCARVASLRNQKHSANSLSPRK